MSKSYETDRKPLGHVPPVPSTTPSVSSTTRGTPGTRGAYRTQGARCLPRPNEFEITVNRSPRLTALWRVTLIPARLALGRYLIRGCGDPPERLATQYRVPRKSGRLSTVFYLVKPRKLEGNGID